MTMMAELSKQAYCAPEAFADPSMAFTAKLVGQPEFFTDPKTDAQSYGLVLDLSEFGGVKTPVLVYRGTSSILDAVADSEVKLVQAAWAPRGVMVHEGFGGDFLALRGQTDAWLGGVAAGGALICTGHSLGSSQSCIAALAYAYQGFETSWIGFGTPRCGNGKFAREYKRIVQESTFVAHSYDPVVSCIPPGIYVRVGTHVQLGCYDPFMDLCLMSQLADHDAAAYVKCLRKGEIVTHFTLTGQFDYLIQIPSTVFASAVNLYKTWK